MITIVIISIQFIFIIVIWAVSIIISLCVCVNTLVSNATDYLSYEVETVVEIQTGIQVDFPAITFCTIEMCNSKLPEYNYKYYLNEYLNKNNVITNSSNLADFILNSSTILLNEYAKEAYINSLTNDLKQELKQGQSDLNKMLISCMYNGNFCYEQDFEYFQISEFEKCYRFNGVENRNGTKTTVRQADRYGNKEYGLNIELFIGFSSKCQTPFNLQEGIFLFVHNNTNNISWNSNGDELVPGRETNIAIDRTYIMKQEYPYSECIPKFVKPSLTNTYIDLTFQTIGSYSQPTCMLINPCYYNLIFIFNLNFF